MEMKYGFWAVRYSRVDNSLQNSSKMSNKPVDSIDLLKFDDICHLYKRGVERRPIITLKNQKQNQNQNQNQNQKGLTSAIAISSDLRLIKPDEIYNITSRNSCYVRESKAFGNGDDHLPNSPCLR